MIQLFILAISFIIVYLVTPDIRYIALKVSAIDKKNHRKIHKKVVAKLGGLAIYLGIWGGLSITAILNPSFFREHLIHIMGLGVCSTLMLLLGMYDDFHGSGAAFKFIIQIVIALLFVKVGFRLERITFFNLVDIRLGIFGVPFTVLWLVGVTNAINLIDGLDGLATGIVAIASVFFCMYGILFGESFVIFTALALLGSSLAFLKYNFHPAKIFLGDTGSLFLGFLVGGLAVWNSKSTLHYPFFLPAIIVLLVPIIDTLLAIARRIARGQHPFRGDASHLHHYYLRRGLTQVQVVYGFYAVTFILGLTSLLLFHGRSF